MLKTEFAEIYGFAPSQGLGCFYINSTVVYKKTFCWIIYASMLKSLESVRMALKLYNGVPEDRIQGWV